MTPSQTSFLTRFIQSARPLMLEYLTINSCIAASRVTLECLRLTGLVGAASHPTKFVVSRLAKELAYTSGLSDAEIGTAKQATAYKPYQAAAPTSGGPGGRGWNGHLVVSLPDGTFIDSAFDQCLPPLGLPHAPTMLTNLGTAWRKKVKLTEGHHLDIGLSIDLPDGSREKLRAQYLFTSDQTYQDTPAWNDEALPLVAKYIVAKLGGV